MIYYTEKEIKEEIDKGKIIILSEGKVYDVTDFADRHPGGREHLVKQVGNDVTQQMESETPHHHSLAAYTILKKYCIGNLMQVRDMQYCIWLNYICYVTSEVMRCIRVETCHVKYTCMMSARSRSLFTSGLINCIAISPFTLTLSKVNKKMSKIYPHDP